LSNNTWIFKSIDFMMHRSSYLARGNI